MALIPPSFFFLKKISPPRQLLAHCGGRSVDHLTSPYRFPRCNLSTEGAVADDCLAAPRAWVEAMHGGPISFEEPVLCIEASAGLVESVCSMKADRGRRHGEGSFGSTTGTCPRLLFGVWVTGLRSQSDLST
jgi:hypothetical protein